MNMETAENKGWRIRETVLCIREVLSCHIWKRKMMDYMH